MSSPVTMQPATADTYIRESFTTTNYGSGTALRVSPLSADRYHSFLKFDFSTLVPAGATIILATLRLYAYTPVSGRTIGCFRLRRADWVENQATWNIYKTGSNWGTAGALNTTTDIDTANEADSASLSSAGWQNWDVTAQVQAALNSYSGIAHFFLRDTGADASSIQLYYSSNYATNTTLRPKLYVEYTLPSVSGASFLLRMI